jgi:DNA-directed RNA polymerase specialized sigma24 family protein
MVPTLPNTDWTLVQQAGDAAPPDAGSRRRRQQAAMQTLLVQYMPALRAHLIAARNVPAEQADDILQAFLAAKVVEDNLIGQARREKGRFRNFIRRTLDDFAISQFRYDNAQKRYPGKLAPLDATDVPAHPGDGPDAVFQKAWAREVIAFAVERMMHECEDTRQPHIWGVFERRILRPALDGIEPMPYAQLVDQFGFESPIKAANALTTAKRMLDRNLRAVLRDYLDDEADVEQELADLRAILAG